MLTLYKFVHNRSENLDECPLIAKSRFQRSMCMHGTMIKYDNQNLNLLSINRNIVIILITKVNQSKCV